MEKKLTFNEEKEIARFWDNWNKNVKIGGQVVEEESDQKQVAEKLGLHKRSITPTTLEKINIGDENTDSSYEELYKYKDNAVTRFCISLGVDDIKTQLKSHNQTQLEIIEKSKSAAKPLKAKNPSVEESKRPEVDQASDSGTNITQKTDKNKEFASLIVLTTFEKEVMQKAADHLSNGYKTALVDVFPRTLTGKNQGQIDIKSLDTHTAILYRTEEGKILLIDPNNPQFSSHLSNFDTNIEALYTPNKLYKIYSRPSNTDTGYDSNKWRDCIDVAVKLAFLLKKEQTAYNDIYKIMESEAVRLITNNDLIDTNYPEFNKPLRAKQSSNLDKITETNTKLKKITEDKLAKQQEKYKSLDIASIEQQISTLKKQLELKQSEYAEDVKLIHENSLLELTGLDSSYFEHHGE